MFIGNMALFPAAIRIPHPLTLQPVDTPVVVDFTPLMGNTKYYYVTMYRPHGSTSSFTAGTEHTFHTQRAIGSTFTFDVEADEHLYDYGDPGLYKITLQNEVADNPDFMISLGDIFGDDHNPWTITSHSLRFFALYLQGSSWHHLPLCSLLHLSWKS